MGYFSAAPSFRVRRNYAGALMFVATCTLVPAFASSAGTSPHESSFSDIEKVSNSICLAKPESKCWMPLAALLSKLGPPHTDREREDVFMAYWMLASAARAVGDFSEARGFYDVTLDLAVGVHSSEPDGIPPNSLNGWSPMISQAFC